MDPRLTSSIRVSLGTALQSFSTQVNGVIRTAAEECKTETLEAEMEAVRAIQIALETIKNVCKEDLDKNVSDLEPTKITAFDLIKGIVENFRERNPEKLQSLKNRAERFVVTQSTDPRWPQLHGLERREVVIDDLARSSLIALPVAFPLSADRKHLAALSFGERVCPLVHCTSQTLIFEVPHSFLGEVPANRYADVPIKLHLPWNTGEWRNGIRGFDYHLGLGCLRLIAGILNIEYLLKKDLHLEKQLSKEIVCNGLQWSPQTSHEVVEAIYPPSGWQIDTTKPPKLIISEGKGDHKEVVENVTPEKFDVKTTVSCRGTNMGSVKFKVEYWIVKDQTEDHKRTETCSLNWKDAKLLEPREGETISKVTFVDTNKVSEVFDTPDQSRALVKIAAEENGKWKVWAVLPDDLKTKFAALPKAMQEEKDKPQFLLTEENLERVIANNRARAQLGLKPASPSPAEGSEKK